MKKLFLLILILVTPSMIIAGSDARYFPKGTFINDKEIPNSIKITNIDGSVLTYSSDDDLQNDYYTGLLIDMDEPSLWLRSNTGKKIESYRLLIEPSFDNYICVRIDIDSSENVSVYLKVRSHDYTDENDKVIKGKLITNLSKSLSKREIKPLIKKLNDINLWKMKEDDFPIVDPESNGISTDGTTFFFEHAKDNKYQAIEIPIPNYGPVDNEVFYQIADSFTDLVD